MVKKRTFYEDYTRMSPLESALVQDLVYRNDFCEYIEGIRRHHKIKVTDFPVPKQGEDLIALAEDLLKQTDVINDPALLMKAIGLCEMFGLHPLEWMLFNLILIRFNIVYRPELSGDPHKIDEDMLRKLKEAYENVRVLLSEGKNEAAIALMEKSEAVLFSGHAISIHSGYMSLNMRLSLNATLKDIKRVWPIIEAYQKCMGGRKKLRPKKYNVKQKVIELDAAHPTLKNKEIAIKVRDDYMRYLEESEGITDAQVRWDTAEKLKLTPNNIGQLRRRGKAKGF